MSSGPGIVGYRKTRLITHMGVLSHYNRNKVPGVTLDKSINQTVSPYYLHQEGTKFINICLFVWLLIGLSKSLNFN